MYVHTYIHACICTYIHASIHSFTSIHTICTYAHIYTYVINFKNNHQNVYSYVCIICISYYYDVLMKYITKSSRKGTKLHGT